MLALYSSQSKDTAFTEKYIIPVSRLVYFLHCSGVTNFSWMVWQAVQNVSKFMPKNSRPLLWNLTTQHAAKLQRNAFDCWKERKLVSVICEAESSCVISCRWVVFPVKQQSFVTCSVLFARVAHYSSEMCTLLNGPWCDNSQVARVARL